MESDSPVGRALRIDVGTTLATSIGTTLRSAILSGELRPGAPLVEAELSRLTGTSRAPLREAILQLRLEGLAVKEQNRIARVATVTDCDIVEIYQLRALLEGWSAHSIATRGSKEQVDELREFVKVQLDPTQEPDAFFAADLAFHERICENSGNSRLVDFWRVLRNQALLCYALTNIRVLLVDSVHRAEIRDSHEHLLDMLSGSPRDAETAFQRHSLESGTNLVATLRGEGVAGF